MPSPQAIAAAKAIEELESQQDDWHGWTEAYREQVQGLIELAYRKALDCRTSASVKCPHCHWGFFPSVIKQHIQEKHS